MTNRTGRSRFQRPAIAAIAFATVIGIGAGAMAQDTIKIAYIDPLSGPGATVGEVGYKTFQFLADYLDRNYEITQKARNALIYPAFIMTTFAVVMTLMMTLVIPKLAEARLSYTRIGCEIDLRLRANADRLQQVLLNLLTNAIKFTPADGIISMECSGDDRCTRIAVRDTGCGIPAEHLEHIFDPFVQVDRNRIDSRQRGVGLGLAISRELVQAMGGELTVMSEVGVGSVFTISLPTAEEEVMTVAVAK